jgi:hypothetical protein
LPSGVRETPTPVFDFKVGDEYGKGKSTKQITSGSLAEIYAKAGRIGTAAIKAELELAGDDAESRKAKTLESWVDLMLEE